MQKKILVVGGGGREHAIIKALKKSPDCGEIWCAPGNGGISYDAKCKNIKATDVETMVAFAAEEKFDYVVVAQDDPLALGMVDALAAVGIPAFGPDKAAARIEASKVFSKDLMKKYGIPTAKYETFDDPAKVMDYIRAEGKYPVVIKADGLALGKGVLICENEQQAADGVKEIMLLGQNVNSYKAGEVDFPELMRLVASVSPSLRVRFATSHPKDMSDRLLEVMASQPNICRCIHLPAQSGSSRMLEKMNRKYTREWYLDRIAAIRRYMPDCAITTDLIAGFCSETDEDHRQTLSLMREVGYEFAYMFKYSERPDTFAQRHMPDDVPDSVKTARLNEIIALQNTLSAESNARDVGKEFEILVEGTSKRSDRQLFGRTSQNKVVVFDRGECRIGDYVRVRVTASSSATLQGELVERTRPFEV